MRGSGVIIAVVSFGFSVQNLYSLDLQSLNLQLKAKVSITSPFEPPTEVPLPFMGIAPQGSRIGIITDWQGEFQLPVDPTRLSFILYSDGPELHIQNCTFGCTYSLNYLPYPKESGEIILADKNVVIGNKIYVAYSEVERNLMYHLIRAWTATHDYGAHTTGVQNPLVAYYGSTESVCQANFQYQRMHFYAAGTFYGNNTILNCRDTALVPSIIYHEFGHWKFGDLGNLATEEALADVFSFTMTGDPRIGLGIFTDREEQSNYLRDVSFRDDRNRPAYYDPKNYEKLNYYQQSKILSGAMWDLRELLIGKKGPVPGRERFFSLFMGAVQTLRSIPSLYDALVAVDDDDNNLSNGTPDLEQINAAFKPRCIVKGVQASYCAAN